MKNIFSLSRHSSLLLTLILAGEACLCAYSILETDVFLPLIGVNTDTYYVSKLGDNTRGTDWESAWSELDQIRWHLLKPGDTVILDGGAESMTYVTTLRIGASGSEGRPITIRKSREEGRNGQVVLFGGRETLLPACGQQQFDPQDGDVLSNGVFVGDNQWLTIDGVTWRGIAIHGFGQRGIRFSNPSANVVVRNVEIYNVGWGWQHESGWAPDGSGIRLAGQDITIERAIIHDNGQDAIQAGDGVSNFTLRDSWLYNSRQHPAVDESFNYCSHSDGLQVFDGGAQSGFRLLESIIGPGFTNGIIMGSRLDSGQVKAITNNVELRDVVFTKAADNNILSFQGAKPVGWRLDHVTAYCTTTKWHCLFLEGSGHAITNSIFVGAGLTLPDQVEVSEGNCQWQTVGYTLGQVADPLFANAHEADPFSEDDYSLAPTSPCRDRGSRVTSAAALVARP